MDTYAVLRLFLEHGMNTGEKGNDFSRLRDFYEWGAFVGEYPEFDRQLALALKETRAQGNIKGEAVRFRHPTKGPLEAAELRIVIHAIRDEMGASEDRAVVMTHIELGPNPQSVARLRQSDLQRFQVRTVEKGRSRVHTRYQLDLPRVKKRTENRETVPRPISNELGELLEKLKSEHEPFLFHWLDSTYPERDIAAAMVRFVQDGELISPRTGSHSSFIPDGVATR
jgi:hypothetical protein